MPSWVMRWVVRRGFQDDFKIKATFATKKEAQQEIHEHIVDCREAVRMGDMESCPKKCEFRIVLA